ncbi:uncharacterized protein MELLADRAFT_109695 [Melampsora larici-populina 98AG31]|uniref:Uncharacterized protein n=1 Tax=Melampsora larici-populina (strain 98AG31 / pathotype 3-4-7) TaxID=747676 RepID=F4RXB6_MELLP|nr:uncharacterized protein MELLADRAFT_109695 [Melampsora larici-populina 98AG31]EGG03016.1 hypothetical protein MELLADRAFT_109695 [Melampsora larici-populina 98AG31]
MLGETDQSQFLKGREATETSSKRIDQVSLQKDSKSSSDGNDRRFGKPQSKPKFVRHGSDPLKGIGGWQLFGLDSKKLPKLKNPQDLSKDEVGESYRNEFVTTEKKESDPKKSKKKFRFSLKIKKPDQSNDVKKSDASTTSEEPFSFESDAASFSFETPRRVGDGM